MEAIILMFPTKKELRDGQFLQLRSAVTKHMIDHRSSYRRALRHDIAVTLEVKRLAKIGMIHLMHVRSRRVIEDKDIEQAILMNAFTYVRKRFDNPRYTCTIESAVEALLAELEGNEFTVAWKLDKNNFAVTKPLKITRY